MKQNIGSYDIAARFVLSCGLLVMGNHGHPWLVGVGLGSIVLCGFGRCPLWWLLRIDTTLCDQERAVTRDERRPRGKSPAENSFANRTDNRGCAAAVVAKRFIVPTRAADVRLGSSRMTDDRGR